MSKKKRAEERRVLAEMNEAIEQEKTSADTEGEASQTQAQTLHCRRCKAAMQNGVCPVCGYKTYIPMDEAKRKKIKGVVTVVCLAIFIVLFAIIKS